MYKETLLLHDYITDPVGHPWDILYIEVFNVFMPLRTVVITVVFAYS